MMSAMSSNVILAKARAMYGSRLTAADYAALLKCRSVGEAAGYLKKNTRYAPELVNVNELSVHRGYLEALLHRRVFDDYAALCRYELSVGEQLSSYIIEKGEIEQILHSLRLLSAERNREYLLTLPNFFGTHLRFDVQKVARANNFDEFLKAMEGTPYRRLLTPFRPEPGENPDFAAIEHALYSRLYSDVFEVIDKRAPRAARRDLHELFGGLIDVLNITRILRMKEFYHASPDYIRSLILPFSFHLAPKRLTQMLQAETADGVLQQLTGTVYAKGLAAQEEQNISLEHALLQLRYARCAHQVHFSVHPSVVMVAYLSLCEMEVTNLITIVEGLRYGLEPERIRKMLVQ